MAGKPQASPRPAFTIARFAIDGPVLPLVTETLPLAEQTRRCLLGLCQRLARRGEPGLADADVWRLSPAFWGKDENGQPRTGHEHAFFLPADEDGDGRLDHVTVCASMGFSPLERQAIDRFRSLRFGDGEPLSLVLVGLGNRPDFRSPLVAESTVWLSATPFVVTRYPKLRGRKRDRPEDFASPQDFTRCILSEELRRRPQLPGVESIETVAGIGPHHLRPIQFRRLRDKRGDDGVRRPSAGFRITFTAPVHGPLSLGHACHFGLGLFLPSPSPEAPRAAR